MANKAGLKTSASGIVIGDANVAFCSLDGSSSSDAFGVSVGNTSQRPTTGKTAMFRWNTDIPGFEYYNGSAWVPFSAGATVYYQNGTIVLTTANVNFVNGPSIVWNVSANGAQLNVSANVTGGGGTINVGANGTYDLAAANLNLLNTVSINVSVQSNTGNTANASFTVNVANVVGPYAANANAAYAQANTAEADAQQGITIAEEAYAQANLAYTAANSAQTSANAAANTVATYANGTLVLAKANLNFNNTGSISVVATANGTTQSNIAFNFNGSAIIANTQRGIVASGNTQGTATVLLANNNALIEVLEAPPFSLNANLLMLASNNATLYGYDVANGFGTLTPNTFDGLTVSAIYETESGGVPLNFSMVFTTNSVSQIQFIFNYATFVDVLGNTQIYYANAAAYYPDTGPGGGPSVGNTLVQWVPAFQSDYNSFYDSSNSHYFHANIEINWGLISSGVLLPPIVLGQEYTIFNQDLANNLYVYPSGNDQIDFQGNGQPYLVLTGDETTFYALNANSYYTSNTQPFQVDVYNEGSLYQINAAIDFVSTPSITVTVSTNNANDDIVDVTYDINSSLNLVSLNVSSNIANVGNLQVTQNTTTGNLAVSTLANIATANIPTLYSPNTWTYANGTTVVATANVNFNNTATVNVSAAANGQQSNISFNANANALIASANQSNLSTVVEANGQIQIDTRLASGGAGTPGGSNTNIQFNDNNTFGGSNNFVYDKVNIAVGIGNTNPAGVGFGQVLVLQNNYTRMTLICTGNGNNSGYRIQTQNATGVIGQSGIYGVPTAPIGNRYIGISADDANYQVVVSANGNVGIDTAAPQANLDVNGIARANTHQDHYSNTGLPATFSNTVVTSNNCTVYPNGTILVTDTSSANWDAFAFGRAMSGSMMIRGQQTDNGGSGMMIGLSQNPTTMTAGGANANSTYVALDFALYYATGTITIYENGSSPASFGGYTAGNGGAVMYDGNNVTYFANTYASGWVPVRTVNKPGLTLTPCYVGIGNRRGNVAANVYFTTIQTMDCNVGTYQDITLANNIYLTLQNCATTGNVSTITLLLRQTTQTNCGMAFANTVYWSDNMLPGLSAGPNTGDVVTLITYNGGTTWWGSQVMGNTPSANIY